jgi:hypothetical protein
MLFKIRQEKEKIDKRADYQDFNIEELNEYEYTNKLRIENMLDISMTFKFSDTPEYNPD